MASAQRKAACRKRTRRQILLKIPPLFLQADSPLPTALIPPLNKPCVCTSLCERRGLVVSSNPGTKEDQKRGEGQKFPGDSGKSMAEPFPQWTHSSFLPEIIVLTVFTPNTCPVFVTSLFFCLQSLSSCLHLNTGEVGCEGFGGVYQPEHNNPALFFPTVVTQRL